MRQSGAKIAAPFDAGHVAVMREWIAVTRDGSAVNRDNVGVMANLISLSGIAGVVRRQSVAVCLHLLVIVRDRFADMRKSVGEAATTCGPDRGGESFHSFPLEKKCRPMLPENLEGSSKAFRRPFEDLSKTRVTSNGIRHVEPEKSSLERLLPASRE